MRKEPLEVVKDAFGNDIKVGDELVFFDKIFGRLSKTHLKKIINKSRVAVVSANVDGAENLKPTCTIMDEPFTWTVSTKKVMKIIS